jgi:hypothetical protein
MNAKYLFNLTGINFWYLASAIALNLFWTLGIGLAVSVLIMQQVQSSAGILQLLLLAASFIGPFLIGFVIGRLAGDGRGPTYGLYGSLGSVGVLLVAALPAGLIGLMMIVAAVAGGLNGGLASIRRR